MTAAPLTPSAAQLTEIVRQACARVLEVDPAEVDPSTRFAEDLGADSLALVEIIEILEGRLVEMVGPSLRIQDEDVDGLRTVGEAVEHAQLLLAPRSRP